MEGETALPRQSGELIFQDPWEGIAFAMAVALWEREIYQWDVFRDHLVAEITAAEQQDPELRPTYYECWLAAFEALLVGKGVLAKQKIDTKVGWLARAASPLRARSLPWLPRDLPDEDE
ncbi:MAG: nitrile hydratase accessory protein [Candidatus Binatia bacterium]